MNAQEKIITIMLEIAEKNFGKPFKRDSKAVYYRTNGKTKRVPYSFFEETYNQLIENHNK